MRWNQYLTEALHAEEIWVHDLIPKKSCTFRWYRPKSRTLKWVSWFWGQKGRRLLDSDQLWDETFAFRMSHQCTNQKYPSKKADKVRFKKKKKKGYLLFHLLPPRCSSLKFNHKIHTPFFSVFNFATLLPSFYSLMCLRASQIIHHIIQELYPPKQLYSTPSSNHKSRPEIITAWREIKCAISTSFYWRYSLSGLKEVFFPLRLHMSNHNEPNCFHFRGN